MRRKCFWIAASCILAVVCLRPVFSSGAAPTGMEKVIYSFTGGADGGQPISDLTLDAAGNLYGTTKYGGTGTGCNSGCGTVFELKRSKDGWKEEVLYSFVGGKDGSVPGGGVIFDGAGNLYGTTFGGGEFSYGTAFKLTPNSRGGWTESIIYSFNFCCSGPQGDLVFDASGSLYGTFQTGVSSGKSCADDGCGAVFELAPQTDGSWAETTIHTFTDTGGDGATPTGVVLDSAGNVYGATMFGGTGSCDFGGFPSGAILGCGTTYRATRRADGKWEETVLHNFARGRGLSVYPSSRIFLDGADHLLGVTQQGGDGLGAIFELQDTRKHGWQQSVIYRFYGNPDGRFQLNPDGRVPMGRLERDAEGHLFGVTSGGGTNNLGTVFEVKRLGSGWREKVLHSFGGGTDGLNPQAGVVSDSQGHLYGTTQQGGSGTGCNGGCGTVYEVTH